MKLNNDWTVTIRGNSLGIYLYVEGYDGYEGGMSDYLSYDEALAWIEGLRAELLAAREESEQVRVLEAARQKLLDAAELEKECNMVTRAEIRKLIKDNKELVLGWLSEED